MQKILIELVEMQNILHCAQSNATSFTSCADSNPAIPHAQESADTPQMQNIFEF
jgi:hypothetical protein